MLVCNSVIENSDDVFFDINTHTLYCGELIETRSGNFLDIDVDTKAVRTDYLIKGATTLEVGPITLDRVKDLCKFELANTISGVSTSSKKGVFFLSSINDPYIRANGALAKNDSYAVWKLISTNIFGHPTLEEAGSIERYDVTEFINALYKKYRFDINSKNQDLYVKVARKFLNAIGTFDTNSINVENILNESNTNFDWCTKPLSIPIIKFTLNNNLKPQIELESNDSRKTVKVKYKIADYSEDLNFSEYVNNGKDVWTEYKGTPLTDEKYFDPQSGKFEKIIFAKNVYSPDSSVTIESEVVSKPGGFGNTVTGDWLQLRRESSISSQNLTLKKSESSEEQYIGNIIR